jgi:multiple sugar transport system permease protein
MKRLARHEIDGAILDLDENVRPKLSVELRELDVGALGAIGIHVFVLSTRFLPPLAVVVPVLLMYRRFGLENTHLGLILLYTSFNLSLAVWLMKGFIDEIPRAFEEAALVDGYSRLAAFVRVIVPEAATGMAVTAVFCLISSWNEFGFAMTLNNYEAKTVPVYFAGLQGNIDGVPWPQIAAGMMIFVAPIVLFTVLVRKHLLRGVTFGTIKQ